ncbi:MULTISPECIES: single-stranded DNA-binding protein [Sphingobacterium]|jgi:single-strand DNA-binding protein|uniref:Single-stranded DNA-binding protein n=1 Tax=Sphingobacterium litopenaei TaxID=2763500 RepID=A0ABR7YF42_9SPHI|nr:MULTISPECIES: single-stranded DNA-binding protein [Sphingobacterium]MBD1429930.1 single-stranded DNA-binding protein [Sphingobacterium litopenaei]NGM74364.1 single-stranded DNA-binding protein [Sphingobacterium sp. SGL-16]
MSSVNKVILVGHLGKDPELRYLEGNVSVASFPLATSETFNKDGKKVEQTEWHNIVMWRGLADVAAKYLTKGRLVYIEGKLRTRSYEDKEGVRRYTTEIVAESFNILGRRSDFENTNNSNSSNNNTTNQAQEQSVDFTENDTDDGLPF